MQRTVSALTLRRPTVLKLVALVAIAALIVLFVQRQMKHAAHRRRREERRLRYQTIKQEWDEAMSRGPSAGAIAERERQG